jgi:hypothetical protein
MFTEQDWKDWVHSPISQALYQEMQDRVIDFSQQILTRRVSNPLDDQYLKGCINAIAAIGEWSPEIIEEEKPNEA